jgi:iron(III) transport system ATP-binding protein
MTQTSAVELRGVTKSFGDTSPAVRDISLTLKAGEILVLLGASGCGKSTTLRLIAGLETPDSGEIWLDGALAAGKGVWVPPERRRVGMVFQDYALFPHLTAAQNVAFPLHGLGKEDRRARVTDLLGRTGLGALADRFPHQLSGGEQQRVAVARALASQPTVLLLDEPFSNLDAVLRRELRDDIIRTLRSAGAASMIVTHDREEALVLADRVAIIERGRIMQADTPRMIYQQPASRDLALFMGEANFLPAQASGREAETPLGRVPLYQAMHGAVTVMVRPEMLYVFPAGAGAGHDGVVQDIQYFGHDQLVRIRLADGTDLNARTWSRADLKVNTPVTVQIQGMATAFR